MKVKHSSPVDEEHRVIVSMTTLEAHLYLQAQPVVRKELARLIRKSLVGCDEKVGG